MSAAQQTPTKTKSLERTPARRKSTPVTGRKNRRNENDGSTSAPSRDGPRDSDKKLKIFHYFGGSSAKTTTPPTPPTLAAGATAGREVPQPGPRVTESPRAVTASPAPKWGKLVDPRKQRRWEMLRCLQDRGEGGIDPTAWARRSYTLSYTPLFQDMRTPGMGSNGGWGWASQSQVFGGARACLTSSDPLSVASHESRSDVHADELGVGDRTSIASRGGRIDLQATNFRTMVAWLSSSYASVTGARAKLLFTGAADPEKSLLEVAVERQDGGPASAFTSLMSLAPEPRSEVEESAHDPVAFALHLYHAGSTWRRVSQHPAPRRQGPGARLHPNNPDLAAAVDEADDRERRWRSNADHAGALALLNAGLAISLLDAVGTIAASGEGYRESGCCKDPDPLAALALGEALTASETRSLAKALGVSSTLTRESKSDGPGWGKKAAGRDRQGSGGEGKDEAYRAIEQWLTRPEDAAKRKRRLSRAARQAADLVFAGGRKEAGGESGVVVLRLTNDAREALHRVHVAFFAAARHGPHDVPVVLREGLDRVVFGSVGGASSGGRDGIGGHDSRVALVGARHGKREGKWERRPSPQVLSSVEAFAEYYRLVTLSDALEMAAASGDSGLAYGSLHEASTALIPSGCPLCRRHHLRQRRKKAESTCVSEAALAPPPHCDICELSARVVMRGVGLMERDKDYDNAFHYLEILLQAASQRLSVHRPRYWLRLVTDLGHKRRAMEALRACEKALAEASPPSGEAITSPREEATQASPEATRHSDTRDGLFVRSSSSGTSEPAATAAAVAADQAAAILPLGESLPLLRRAIRLAVPPLRWRRRQPPQLREARLRVMSLDLSWRRASNPGGSASMSPIDDASCLSPRELPAPGGEEEGGFAAESGEEIDKVGGKEQNMRGRGVTPGTSLEQAVLDEMLAELEPGWKGLHSENSICLGLFALLCWDALFASVVPASAAVATAATTTSGRPGTFPGTDRSAQAAPVVAERPQGAPPLPEDPQDSATPNDCCSGIDVRLAAAEREDSVGVGVDDDIPDPATTLPFMGANTLPDVSQNGPSQSAGSGEEEGAVFHPFPSPFQSEPADLMTPAFAGRRRYLLEGVYASVERGCAEALLRQTWSRHYGKACTGLNWKLFPEGVEGWANVAACMGPLPLSCICRNLASNYWAWRHGLPDLFLWRTDATTEQASVTKDDQVESSSAQGVKRGAAADCGTSSCEMGPSGTISGTISGRDRDVGRVAPEGDAEMPHKDALCKWVEVKGPGDSLSSAQEAWIDALVGAGADFILLRVEDAAGPSSQNGTHGCLV